MASGKNRFGWTTFNASERKDTSVTVLIEDGAFTTADIKKMWLFPALVTHQPQVLH